jgi:hypothetical protein
MIYHADEQGNIYNDEGYMLKLYTRNDGYKTFTRYDVDGWKKEYYVHRFVWEYFNGDIPNELQLDHINHDRGDNRLDNLRLLSPASNVRRRDYNKLNLTSCRAIRKLYDIQILTQKDISEMYECSETTISNCINYKTWA